MIQAPSLPPEFKRSPAARSVGCEGPQVTMPVAPKFHTEAIARPHKLAIGHQIPFANKNLATA